MYTMTFNHNPLGAVAGLLHKLEQVLVHAFKTLYAANRAANLCEQGQKLNVQDLRRLGLMD